MPFQIACQDITKFAADAIVNAANIGLRQGGGVCGAIFKAAGAEELQAACLPLAPIKTGEAVITPGFHLPARYVIHAVGPVYQQEDPVGSEMLLRAAYAHSLEIACKHHCESIAFPLISSGIYGYPRKEAFRVAVSEIRHFLQEHEIAVTLVIYDREAVALDSPANLIADIERYLEKHYVRPRDRSNLAPLNTEQCLQQKAYADKNLAASNAEGRVPKDIPPVPEAACFESHTISELAAVSLDEAVGKLDEPFSLLLLRLIDARRMEDCTVYKRANLDRRLFSKIRSQKGYMPSKRTAIALAVALELSLDETEKLLERAGYALSPAVKFDVIVEYFISQRKYDIYEINEVLFQYEQPLLGS